jgi:hypothetical protein
MMASRKLGVSASRSGRTLIFVTVAYYTAEMANKNASTTIGVTHDVPLTPFSLEKTTSAAQAIAPAVAGRAYRLRDYTISSKGDNVVVARIRGTIGGVDTIIEHLSTDDQVGISKTLPGYIECDVGTAINAELDASSNNGILFSLKCEIVGG